MIGFNEYQEKVGQFASYSDKGANIVYPALGLAGEAGEAVDKIKKLWRNKGKFSGKDYNVEEAVELLKELGDVLWYIAAITTELGTELEIVADMNIRKLTDRNNRGVLKSEGDNR